MGDATIEKLSRRFLTDLKFPDTFDYSLQQVTSDDAFKGNGRVFLFIYKWFYAVSIRVNLGSFKSKIQ